MFPPKQCQVPLSLFSRQPPCKATKADPGITHAENFQSKFRCFSLQDRCLLSKDAIFETTELFWLARDNQQKQSMRDKAQLMFFPKDAANAAVTLLVASSSVGDRNKDLIKFKA